MSAGTAAPSEGAAPEGTATVASLPTSSPTVSSAPFIPSTQGLWLTGAWLDDDFF